MNSATRKYSSIAGLTDTVRIPRLGRIRLGHINHNTMSETTHPVEDSFFHVPPEVAEVYGPQPTELDIMFPVNDRSVIFPQALEFYGSSKRLLCSGNGVDAHRWDQNKLEYTPCACPCPKYNNGCSERGHLMVILPKVKNQGGVYQIDTGSIHAITAINSCLNILAPDKDPDSGLLGYFAMTPLKLRRVKREIFPRGHHKTSYPIQISLAADENDIVVLRARKDEVLAKTRCWQVEEPEQINPTVDTGASVSIDDQPLGADHQGHTPDSLTPLPPATAALATPPQQSQPMAAPPQSAPASSEPPIPLNMMVTKRQLEHILQQTRKVKIPDDVVEQRTKDLTKKQASDLITQLGQQDFRFFEQRETTSVSMPCTA